MNNENLKSNDERTPDERRELASKAGKASGKARKETASLRKTLDMILNLPAQGENAKKLFKEFGITENMTNRMLIALSAVKRGITTGEPKVLTFIRDTLGENLKFMVEEDTSQENKRTIKIYLPEIDSTNEDG
ncbi:MAG: hypothetical protein Q8876_03690 [Bacillota bacterium]|nr:hypothetical protein [Bacillota bacterium]